MSVQQIVTPIQIEHTALEAPSQEQLDALNKQLASLSPQEIIAWAIDKFGEGLILACSFGGISGMALLDMSVRIRPEIDVFYLDTDFLFPQTLKTRDEAVEKYGIQPTAYKSRFTPAQQADRFGDKLWLSDPDKCCSLRKVEPNQRALEGRTAWITGLRRDQSSTRREVAPISWDAKFNAYKINPLAYWDERQVWRYINENDVPYNPLHDEGFPSVGCTHCTRAVGENEDMRAGRWSGIGKVECGLHK